MNGSHEVICQWLGIPRDAWPPDHYTLLGLPAGETNVDRIEQRVQERMELVRRYQLSHPEASTEAMNRLAQAFSCLSEALSKRAYDRNQLGLKVDTPTGEAVRQEGGRVESAVAGPPVATEVVTQEAPESAEVIQWDREIEPPAPPVPASVPAPPVVPAAPAPPPVDPLVRTAQKSRIARRGLGTKKALYHRITQTRALLHEWESAGKYLANPKRRPRNPAEARELIGALRRIVRWLTEFPAILGEAGQAGYLVVALARQSTIVPTFQSLLPSQREALARDWSNGQKLLTAHKDFLRSEVKSLRRKPLLHLGVRAAIAFLDEHPVVLLVMIGVVALAIAVVRTLV